MRSSEKRDPGFVKLRRGLLPHLSSMSSNAAKLYVFLLLKAHWKLGPKRGLAEVSYEDITCDLGWSYSMVRRTIRELTRKNYIEVTPAANQYDLTRIKVLKYSSTTPTNLILMCPRVSVPKQPTVLLCSLVRPAPSSSVNLALSAATRPSHRTKMTYRSLRR